MRLGGGSFQLAAGTGKEFERGGSTRVGAYRVAEDLLPRRAPITADDFEAADRGLCEIAPMPLSEADIAGRRLVASGYDASFLAVHFGRATITVRDLEEMRAELGGQNLSERVRTIVAQKNISRLKGLALHEPSAVGAYAEVLPGVLTLMLHIMKQTGNESFTVSRTDSRHAMVDLAARRS